MSMFIHIFENPNKIKQFPYIVSHEKTQVSFSKLTVFSLSLMQALVIIILTFSQQTKCDTFPEDE